MSRRSEAHVKNGPLLQQLFVKIQIGSVKIGEGDQTVKIVERHMAVVECDHSGFAKGT